MDIGNEKSKIDRIEERRSVLLQKAMEEAQQNAYEKEEIHEYETMVGRLSEEEIRIVEAMAGHLDILDALDTLGRVTVWHGCRSMEEAAEALLSEGDYLNDVPELLKEFMDYKKFGEFMEECGWFVKIDDTTYAEIPDDNQFTWFMNRLCKSL